MRGLPTHLTREAMFGYVWKYIRRVQRGGDQSSYFLKYGCSIYGKIHFQTFIFFMVAFTSRQSTSIFQKNSLNTFRWKATTAGCVSCMVQLAPRRPFLPPVGRRCGGIVGSQWWSSPFLEVRSRLRQRRSQQISLIWRRLPRSNICTSADPIARTSSNTSSRNIGNLKHLILLTKARSWQKSYQMWFINERR